MEEAVEVLAIVHFSVVGASHLLRPPSWVAFFTLLREREHAGVFFLAFLSLGFGSLALAALLAWHLVSVNLGDLGA